MKIILSLTYVYLSVAFKLPDINETVDNRTHLNFKKVQQACSEIDTICKTNDTRVCSVRRANERMEYKNFNNSCYVYMSNMCHYFENEFSIIVSGTCKEFFKSRRSSPIDAPKNVTVEKSGTNKSTIDNTKPKNKLRSQTPAPLYDIETAFDYHTCPPSCPNAYAPVCLSVNRGHGMYFKFYTFASHCDGDLYYCKHWQEFSPPPDEGEMVKSSPLSWSLCAAYKYIQFARFGEVTSSMGYYGWLAGDHKYSHIVEPHERIPGYG